MVNFPCFSLSLRIEFVVISGNVSELTKKNMGETTFKLVKSDLDPVVFRLQKRSTVLYIASTSLFCKSVYRIIGVRG
jgi:hypothetical protein